MLEDAAYRRMLDLYYASERPLPKNRDGLYRLIRAKSKVERDAVDVVLGEFFFEADGGWRNARADIEIQRHQGRASTARENGLRGGRPKTQKEPSDNPAGLQPETQEKTNQNHNQNHNQKPKKDEEVAVLPDWLPLEAWKPFLEMRRKKKIANGARALNMLLTELERLKSLGFDPAAVIDQSTLKGWTSFYPLKPELVSVSAEPKAKLCDYCPKIATGTVNGRRACAEHWQLAMDNERPAKVAA
jgi:uncharacterized protein YdaU (DUF1376 family)